PQLDLDSTQLSDRVGQALAEALKVNKTLTQLDLGFNQISDRGGEAEALKVDNTLTQLDLPGNEISARGGEVLGDISDCAKQNGTMPHYTTFNYENILGILNRLTHGTNGNVQQIITHLKFRYV
ncbi:unnamed protein product, partial [Didymodactylos carnosus]